MEAGNTPARFGYAGDVYTCTYTYMYKVKQPTAQHGGVHLPISAEIRQRRLVRADNTPVRTGFTRDTYTLTDEMVDGTTRCARKEREDRK